MDRSPDYYLNKAKLKSDELYQLIGPMFAQNRHPGQLYRICDRLLTLQRKTDRCDFHKACLMAIEYKNYSYRFILNILTNKMTDQTETKQQEKHFPIMLIDISKPAQSIRRKTITFNGVNNYAELKYSPKNKFPFYIGNGHRP